MTESYDKLRRLLDELFQFDRQDLDFGIYRIMNHRRAEISRFLDEDLLPQVQAALQQHHAGEADRIRERMAEIEREAARYGAAPEQNSEYVGLSEQLERADTSSLEDRVYSDLYTFFRRYYKEGDFLSLRRYKPGVYAIPYEGEEVKLHWANADQYYVKTAENFHNYRFNLGDGGRVSFELASAGSERDNNKAANGKERRFVLRDEEPLEERDGELVVFFEYRPHSEKQSNLDAAAVESILAAAPGEWKARLAEPAPTQSNKERTLLAKHLSEYTARNTFDYFIHKDLGGFLRRELDFFLKNEVLHIDDLDTEDEPRVEQYLSRLKVMKRIGYKIISFLAQIEDFQKKLFLKKKFVVSSDYCLTLDHVPEALYPEIAANDDQYEEWEKLFTISEIENNLENGGDQRSVEWLRDNPYLVLDTQFFDQDFKDRLLARIEELDEKTDGLLIESENFQALTLLQTRYQDQAQLIYMDPPYNTGSGDFVYKDNYQHSSWLTMMSDRVLLESKLLSSDSFIFTSIDDHEVHNLKNLFLDLGFRDSTLPTITWEKRTKAQNTETARQMLQSKTEYILGIRTSTGSQKFFLESAAPKEYPFSDEKGRYRVQEVGQMSAEGIRGRTTMVYPIRGIMPRENMQWKLGQNEIASLDSKGQLLIDNNKPFIIIRPEDESEERFSPFWSHFFDKDSYGTAETGAAEVREDLGFGRIIETVKPTKLIQKLVYHSTSSHGSLVCDFFAGSGTTAHAVIDLNRASSGSRKYVLTEMGGYFEPLLKPRVQKAIYSKDWKDGKPVSREGTSHIFKYIKLESYEDTLDNLSVSRSATQNDLIESNEALREDYMLSYMLDFETRGSPSLLNIDAFDDPFSYKLNVTRGNETRTENVDLVETLNYLLGLTVSRVQTIDVFRVVEGSNPAGERVLVIWRNTKEKPDGELTAFFESQGFAAAGFDRIYVNGDNTLENLKETGQRWKVLLIEEEFQRLMFETEDV